MLHLTMNVPLSNAHFGSVGAAINIDLDTISDRDRAFVRDVLTIFGVDVAALDGGADHEPKK